MFAMYKKILVPTDGSEYALRAEEQALFIAKMTGAEVIALSVIENNFVNTLPLDSEIYELTNLLKEDSEKNIEEFEDLNEKEHDDVKITPVIKEGSPAKEIIQTAQEQGADLIVIGSSGKSGFDKFLMGSVADKVVKSAKCSVLVVH